MHEGEEGHARPGWTSSRRGQDSLWKSQSEWQRTGINGESTSMVWPTLGSRTAKEQNKFSLTLLPMLLPTSRTQVCFYLCLLSILFFSGSLFCCFLVYIWLPSVLWRCWLGGRKGIRPVKNGVVRWWHGYLSGARCRLAYGPADVTATHSCFSKIQIGFTFLVPAHPGSPGKRAVKRVCVIGLVEVVQPVSTLIVANNCKRVVIRISCRT